MKRIYFILSLFLGVLFFSSCEESGIAMETSEIGIDPELNVEGFNRALQGKGFFIDDEMPVASTASGLSIKVTNSIKQISTPEGESVIIPFTVSDIGPAKVCGINLQVLDTYGYWKMPVTHNVVNDYYAEFTIPRIVKPGEVSFVYNVEVCYNGETYVSNKDTTTITFEKDLNCGDSLQGTIGLVIRKFQLGDKKGKVKVSWGTGYVGDRLDIRQGKNYIFSTGSLLGVGKYPSCSMNGFVSTLPGEYKTYLIDFDPAKGQSLLFFCYGNCGNNINKWDLHVACPE